MPDQDATYESGAGEPEAATDRPRQAGRSMTAVLVFVGVAALMVAADLTLKYAAFEHVAREPVRNVAESAENHRAFWHKYAHEPIEVVPNVLSLKLTTNTGAVFGWGEGSQWLFILVSLAVVPLIGHIFWRSPARAHVLHVGLALILAGALGNLYDRVRYSAVRDMLRMFPDVHLPFGLAWPGGKSELWPWIFNLADVALVIGVITVIALTWWHELRARSAE